MNTENNNTEEPQRMVSLGKAPITVLKNSCKGCNAKVSNFFKWCLPDDFMSWNCQNCGNTYSFKARDNTENFIALGVEIDNFIVTLTRFKPCDGSKDYVFALVNNSVFKEVTL